MSGSIAHTNSQPIVKLVDRFYRLKRSTELYAFYWSKPHMKSGRRASCQWLNDVNGTHISLPVAFLYSNSSYRVLWRVINKYLGSMRHEWDIAVISALRRVSSFLYSTLFTALHRLFNTIRFRQTRVMTSWNYQEPSGHDRSPVLAFPLEVHLVPLLSIQASISRRL